MNWQKINLRNFDYMCLLTYKNNCAIHIFSRNN